MLPVSSCAGPARIWWRMGPRALTGLVTALCVGLFVSSLLGVNSWHSVVAIRVVENLASAVKMVVICAAKKRDARCRHTRSRQREDDVERARDGTETYVSRHFSITRHRSF
jgi:hypothetical protein